MQVVAIPKVLAGPGTSCSAMIVRQGTHWFVSRATALAALELLGTGRFRPTWRGALRFERGGKLLVVALGPRC